MTQHGESARIDHGRGNDEATEQEAPQAVAAAEEPVPEAVGEAMPALITKPKPAIVTETKPKPRRTRYRYVKDETLEQIVVSEKQPRSRRGRRRELVLDEESGQLIAQRKHKRGDDDEADWEDIDY